MIAAMVAVLAVVTFVFGVAISNGVWRKALLRWDCDEFTVDIMPGLLAMFWPATVWFLPLGGLLARTFRASRMTPKEKQEALQDKHDALQRRIRELEQELGLNR